MSTTSLPGVAAAADFTAIRYAQCWEDADVLIEALAPAPGQTLISIASAGDNTLALLTGRPERVIAFDLSPAQLACLALRIAAYRALTHPELLQLIGSRPSTRRRDLYARCRSQLSADTRAFWDARGDAIDAGIGSAGRFERYFTTFRTRVLPLVHRREVVRRLLAGGGTAASRLGFYEGAWNTWAWRAMFRVFFSRTVMGRLGRDPAFFTHVEGSVADRILARARHAMTTLDPALNPYMHWILTGTHGEALPLALRPEHFETIRDGLDRVTWHERDVLGVAGGLDAGSVHGANLSDVFEYMSVPEYHHHLDALCRVLAPGGRLAYWNMLVPRRRPGTLASVLEPLEPLARTLHERDKAFFYGAFVVEARA